MGGGGIVVKQHGPQWQPKVARVAHECNDASTPHMDCPTPAMVHVDWQAAELASNGGIGAGGG